MKIRQIQVEYASSSGKNQGLWFLGRDVGNIEKQLHDLPIL